MLRNQQFDLADQAVRFWIAFISLNVAALLLSQVRPLLDRPTEDQNVSKRYWLPIQLFTGRNA
jgi:hypothetical protein